MISTREQKLEIQNFLSSLYPLVKGQAPKFRTRCILCGDSKIDPNKMRLGIKVDPDDDEPIIYHCFNCEARGLLTNRMLKDISEGSLPVNVSVDSVNKTIIDSSGNVKINKYKNTKVVKVVIPPLRKDDNQIRKAKFMFDRIGRIIDPNDFQSLKIIWSLNDFLNINRIKPNSEYTWMLEKDYVGFLSINNDFIIFRDITNKHKMRYVKYNIFGFYDNSKCFYATTGSLDLMTLDDIHINIAEGPFDILSVLYNLENNDRKNKIYVASGNSNFYSPLVHYFDKGIVGDNIKIDIFKDNDSKIDYRSLRKRLKVYIVNSSNMHVYYNAYDGEKDFGVPIERIQKEIFM